MLSITIDYWYRRFNDNHVVMCEGKNLKNVKEIRSAFECSKLCDKEDSCHSFSYCKNKNGTCSLKDKVLRGTEQTVSHDNCTTYYKKCEGSILLFLLSLCLFMFGTITINN